MTHFPSRGAVLTVAALAAVFSTLCLTVRPGHAQVGGALPAFVRLQATTPGVSQTGHSNITGTAIAGQHVGGGAGLTGVNADLLDGINSTAFLQGVPNPLTLSGSNPTHIISGSNSDTTSGSSGVYGESTAATGVAIGGRFLSQSASGRGVSAIASSATGNTFAVYGQSNSVDGRGVFGSAAGGSGANVGVYGQTSSTVGTGVFGGATDTSGINFGVRGETPSTSGRGVYGLASATTGDTFGGLFENNSTTGVAVFGFAISNNGDNIGGLFQTRSNTGVGVQGVAMSTSGASFGGRFESAGLSGRGVYGGATSANGVNYGGRFESVSTTGRGAFGLATSTTGSTYGLLGQVYSSDGIGVFGENFADTGLGYGGRFESDSDFGRGVYGLNNRNTGVNYGVRGQTASAAGYGVFAVGELGATGVKSFRIDHPFDPENKYLLHYSSESPVPQNFYVGNVVTDSSGYAWVELPDYFAEINANFKYQLTVVEEGDSNDFIWAKVVQKVKNNRFRVRTNKPNVEVSWEVKADRNDLYVRRKQPKDQIEKEGLERGRYQHPELYGKPLSMGMDVMPERAAKGENRSSRP